MDSIDIGSTLAGLAIGEGRDTVADGQTVRVARFQGDGAWHSHADGAETVLVWEGQFRVEYRDGGLPTDLHPGQVCIIPPGREHRGVSPAGAAIVSFRPAAAKPAAA